MSVLCNSAAMVLDYLMPLSFEKLFPRSVSGPPGRLRLDTCSVSGAVFRRAGMFDALIWGRYVDEPFSG